jgi:hypothetical protein
MPVRHAPVHELGEADDSSLRYDLLREEKAGID